MPRFAPPLAILILLLLVGCSSTASPPPPTATAIVERVPPLTQERAWLRAASFSPDRHIAVSLGGQGVVYVFHSICTGSTDGHCQAVHAFLPSRTSPVWDAQYAQVQSLKAIPNGFTVEHARFKASDPLCCPSAGVVSDAYTWNGTTFVKRGSAA